MSPLFLKEEDVAGLVWVPETIDVLEAAFADQSTGEATTLPRRRLATHRLFLHLLAGAIPGYCRLQDLRDREGKAALLPVSL